jgi:hypothetical protein
MNTLSRDKQIAVISALTEGCSIRSTERLTGIHRDTIMRLGVRIGKGSAAIHDDMMQFVQVNRLELDELWSYVGKKQRQVKQTDPADLGRGSGLGLSQVYGSLSPGRSGNRASLRRSRDPNPRRRSPPHRGARVHPVRPRTPSRYRPTVADNQLGVWRYVSMRVIVW